MQSLSEEERAMLADPMRSQMGKAFRATRSKAMLDDRRPTTFGTHWQRSDS